jgi:hypothetical protein
MGEKPLPLHAYAPDKPCGCVKADTKTAIADVRATCTGALGALAPTDINGWRDVVLEIFQRVKGL